jgi:subtilase family serine protease
MRLQTQNSRGVEDAEPKHFNGQPLAGKHGDDGPWSDYIYSSGRKVAPGKKQAHRSRGKKGRFTMRRIRTVCLIGSSGRPALALGLAIVFLSTLTARAEYRSLPIRHVPHAVVNGRAPYVSLLPETQKLKLAVMISMRDQAGLNAYLKEAYNPQSPSFHRWLSVSEFADRFGPSEADYQAVVAFAEANGMTIKNTEPGNRMVVDIEASVADINRTFHVAMGTYKHPTEDRTFFAPDREPTVDLTVPLWKIGGLNDYSPPRSHLQFHKQGDKVTSKQTGSGPNGQFLGSDMRSAYYGGTALTGAGQTLGLFEFGGYNVSDVQLYFSTIGQPLNVPISNVLLDGNTVNCGSACSGDGEQVIDIEQAISMAPGAAGMIVYVGSSDVDILNAMASDNKAKQMSCSFGWGDDPSSDDPIFKEFAAQGQNFFVGTRDSGGLSGDCAEVGG